MSPILEENKNERAETDAEEREPGRGDERERKVRGRTRKRRDLKGKGRRAGEGGTAYEQGRQEKPRHRQTR